LLCAVVLAGGFVPGAGAEGFAAESLPSPVTSPLGAGGELSLEEGAGEQAAFEVLQANPETVAAQEASRTRFEGETQSQAANTLAQAFPVVVAEQNGGPPQLPTGVHSLGFVSAEAEQIQTGSGEVGVVQSTVPIAVASTDGRWAAMDLTPREADGGFVPRNPLTSVRMPRHLAEGASFEGLSITPVDEHGVVLGGAEGVPDGAAVFYANTQTDTDTVLKPSTFGVDVGTVLRSVESPKVLYYRVGLPKGARLVASQNQSGAEVVDEGVTIAGIKPPAATDADGIAVPLTLSVSGDTLAVTVKNNEDGYRFPIVVDPELSGYGQEWSNVVPGNWEFHEWIGYTYEIAGAELRMKHEPGGFAENDYAIWSEKTKGYTKLFDVYVRDELYPWSAPEGKRNTPSWLNSFMEMYKPGGGRESRLELTGSPYRSEGTVCGVSGCASAEGDAEGNAFAFALTTKTAGSTGEQFYAHAEQVSTGIAQAYGKHSTVALDTSSSEVEGAPNVLAGGGRWMGRQFGKGQYYSEDGGLGVSESWTEVKGTGGWEKMQNTNFLTNSSCAGIQCATKDKEVFSYKSLTNNGAKPLPEPEAHIRVSAKSYMPYSSSNEHGEGEATLKVDAKPPHGISISGLPAKGEGGKELTLGEGAGHLVAEASDGEGTTPSSGLKELRLYVDGSEVGHGGGACSPGPCVGAAQWSLKGAELGVGAHPMTVQAECVSGERANAEYTLNVYAASPVSAGPGSVNPESGDFALEASDVNISGGTGSLALSRHSDSRIPKEGEEGPFGAPWSASLDNLASLEVLPEGSVMVIGSAGLSYFKAKSGGGFEAPAGDTNLELKYEAKYESGKPAYLFKNAKDNTTTVFTLPEHASSWMPTVSKGPTATNTTTDEYRTVEASAGKFVVQPTLELAPHPSVECGKGHWHAGCRALEFVYNESTSATGESESEWKGYKNRLKEVIAIAYNPATKAIVETPIAAYLYDKLGRLRAAWNPSIKPSLKTTYGYDSENHVTAVTPAGQQPWLMHYGTTPQDTTSGRLLSVGRLGPKTGSWTGEALKSTAAPALSTTSPLIGTTLSVTNGSWSTSSVLYGYQWEDCNSAGAECASIPGAVNATYTPQTRDAGYTVVAQVTAENASGAATAASAASNVVAMPAPTSSSVFGTSGSESEKLSKPAGVTVDSEGHIWVADLGGNRVEKFSSTGTFLASYSPDSMLEPAGIAFSAATGNVYVTNRGRDRVDQISTSGTLVRSFGGEGSELSKLNHPNQVAIDTHGDVWVADTTNKRVNEYSASGTYLGGFATNHGYSEPWQAPVGVAECAGMIYVSDETENNVQEFKLSGEFVARFGTTGTGTGHFVKPQQIACDPAGGDIYVVDSHNNRVEEFNASGTFLDTFGTTTGEGGLSPVGVAVNSNGTVDVGDSGNNRISVWKASYSTNNPVPTPPTLTENPVSTIEYNVPLSGSGPQTMSSTEVAKWAQKDDPVEGAAIYPPDEPMGWPAANYKRATIYYQDEQMRTVNTASPTGGISTSEYNSNNEVERSLSPENRAAALAEPNPAAASELFDTKSGYNEGELTDIWGPQHTVKLAKGKTEPNETAQARNHIKYFYDEGAPTGESYELVTKVVDGAETAGKEEFDVRTSRTYYSGQKGLGWKLRKPTSTVTDPAGMDLTRSTVYDETTGNVVETRTPASNTEVVYPPAFQNTFGSAGSGIGQFSYPEAIAADASGNVWVNDDGNGRVEKFSSSGAIIGAYGSAGTGNREFSEAFGIAVNRTTGDVYIADTGNNRIQELGPNGEFLEAIGWGVSDSKAELEVCKASCKAGIAGSGNGQLDGPDGIAISEGNLFVLDSGNDRVQELSAAGAYMNQFGSNGAGNGQLREPTGIAIAEGDIYVVDFGNDRVQEFTPGGAYLEQFGSKGTGEGQFNYPVSIAVNATSSTLYISDAGNNRIGEYTPAGKYLTEFGTYGTGKGQLSSPTGIAIGASSEIYIADQYNARISTWLPPGAGGARMLYSAQFGSTGSEHGHLSYPLADAIDGHGNVWVSDYGNNRVQEFSPAGQFLAAYGTAGSGHVQFSGPTGIAVNQSTGNVYIGDCGNDRIQELNAEGEWVRFIGSAGPEPGHMGCPHGVKIDPSGNVWIADTEHNRIEEFSSTGTFMTTYGTKGSGEVQFNGPNSLTFSGGNIYIVDTENHRIEELSAAGKYIGQFGVEGIGSGEFLEASDIATDPAGNIYVSDADDHRVQEFSQFGVFEAKFAAGGSGEGQLGGPAGMAINAAGTAYIVDTANNRIEQWISPNEAVHDTKTVYYTAGAEAPVETCKSHPEWVNLPCQTEPTAQPGEGMPQRAVTDLTYNMWDQAATVTEKFGSTERVTATTFDEAGRPRETEEKSTSNQALPKIVDTYNEHNGTAETQRTTVGEKTETITSVANTLGELERYTDADGNVAEYKHDIDGRVTEITDGSEEAIKKDGYQGNQKYQYDETTGELSKLEDSAAGTFHRHVHGGREARQSDLSKRHERQVHIQSSRPEHIGRIQKGNSLHRKMRVVQRQPDPVNPRRSDHASQLPFRRYLHLWPLWLA
jgi:DNA-binding beta-propeller fold protein YncE